jgi:hypothetical protein
MNAVRRLHVSMGALATPHLYQLPALLRGQCSMLLCLMHATGHQCCQKQFILL